MGKAYITNSCRRGVNGRAELQIPVCVFAASLLQLTNYKSKSGRFLHAAIHYTLCSLTGMIAARLYETPCRLFF